jgi:hypothetical protein
MQVKMDRFKLFNILGHGDFFWFLYPTSQPFTYFDDHHPSFLTDTIEKKSIIDDFCYCAKDFKAFEDNMLKRVADGDPEKDFIIFTLFAYCEQHKQLAVLEKMYPYLKDNSYWNISYNFAKALILIDRVSDQIPDQWTPEWVKKLIPESFNTAQILMRDVDVSKLFDDVIAETGLKVDKAEFLNSVKNIIFIKKSNYKVI